MHSRFELKLRKLQEKASANSKKKLEKAKLIGIYSISSQNTCSLESEQLGKRIGDKIIIAMIDAYLLCYLDFSSKFHIINVFVALYQFCIFGNLCSSS